MQEQRNVAVQPAVQPAPHKKLLKLSQKLQQPGLLPEERARILAKLDKRLSKAAAAVEVCLLFSWVRVTAIPHCRALG